MHECFHKYTRVVRGQDSEDKKHDRSGFGEQSYAALCEGSERNVRSPCELCTVRFLGPRIKRREVGNGPRRIR